MSYYKNVKYEDSYESNSYGTMQVIDRAPRKLKVRFLDSGYETWALAANVVAGKVRDEKAAEKRKEEWKPRDEEFVSNGGARGKIVSQKGKRVIVQFHDTGHTMKAYIDNVRAGKIKDPYALSVYGVACLGEVDKKPPYYKQALQLWRNMMKRCYSEKDPRGYFGQGVVVDKRWLCFANFLQDLPKLRNFDKWLQGKEKGREKYNLDKDLLIEGNKVYSKEACQFVTEFENKSAGSRNRHVK